MKVSVIIPNYNHERFLRQRIESVLAQTYRDFEIIMLDDSSTDNSRNIIEQYRSDPKVSSIVYNETNGGSGFKQWSKGIQLAKGELLWIAESDDWCENTFLETLVKGFEENTSCVLAFSQSYFAGNNDEIKGHSSHILPDDGYTSGELFLKNRLIYGCTIFNASMAVFKRAAALLVPEDFTSFKQCGDWYFWINLVRQGDVFTSIKVLNYYRRNGTSLTERSYSTGFNFIEELRMFSLLKKEDKTFTRLIHNSIFNRYNSFQKKKRVLSLQDTQQVSDAFYSFFRTALAFRVFLFEKRTALLFRKLKLRLKNSFKNTGSYKTRTS